MARYVVVEFADNAQAEDFIQRLRQDNEADRRERRPFTTRVAGVFVKPGKTCMCWDRNAINYGDKNRKGGIARGERFGWWVCTICNKPRAAGHQLVNQLKPSELYEGSVYNDFEFGVTNLEVSGFHTEQVDRPKKLRRKKAK